MRALLWTIVLALAGSGLGCGDRDRPSGGGGTVPGFDAGSTGGGGGRSGVSGTRTLDSLTSTEKRQLCEWGIDVQGGPGETTECEFGTVRTGTVEQCTSGFPTSGCSATVRQAEDCILAIAADPCNGPGDPACEPLIACVDGG